MRHKPLSFTHKVCNFTFNDGIYNVFEPDFNEILPVVNVKMILWGYIAC